MTWTRIGTAAALAAALLAPAGAWATDDGDASPRRRVRLGGFSAGASYWSGPAFFPYFGGFGPMYGPYRWGGWGLYDPYWSSPFIHPALYSGFLQTAGTGGVKLIAADKDASVYIDGAYAGPVRRLKTIWLEPGAYHLELRNTSGAAFERKVYVLTGKTVELRADLRGKNEVRP